MPFAKVNDFDLYYEVHGTGPHVILCHGGGSNHLHWWHQVCALRSKYTVVTYDNRGFGWSTGGDKGPSVFADDLRALMDHLSIKRAALLGQSVGGYAVAGVAARHPERVAALIISNSPGGMVPLPPAPGMAAKAQAAKTYLEFLPNLLHQDAFPTRHPEAFFLFESMSQLNVNFDVGHFSELTKIHNEIADIDKAGIPTLFIGGADDHRASAAMTNAATMIKNSRLEMIANAGHLAFFEEPENYNQVVMRFLSEHI